MLQGITFICLFREDDKLTTFAIYCYVLRHVNNFNGNMREDKSYSHGDLAHFCFVLELC